MHVDRDSAGAEYDLVCQWWNGQAWETSVIDDTREYRYVRPKVRVDRHDNIWVFIGDSKFPSVNPRYTVSRDGGRTWAPWQSFGEPGTRVQRPFTYVDPIDPDTHYIFWSDFSTDRVKFVKIQLTMQNP